MSSTHFSTDTVKGQGKINEYFTKYTIKPLWFIRTMSFVTPCSKFHDCFITPSQSWALKLNVYRGLTHHYHQCCSVQPVVFKVMRILDVHCGFEYKVLTTITTDERIITKKSRVIREITRSSSSSIIINGSGSMK